MTIILGIDPGSRVTGYGLIRQIGQKIEYIDSGCIRTSADGELCQKLVQIYDGICQLMDHYSPMEVAIEQVFLHQNPNSALKLGHARGVAMVAAASYRVKVSEYSAREIKQTVVGYGAAQKVQVSHMVVNLLSLNNAPQSDAADALAIAICHSHMRHNISAVLGKRGIRIRKRKR
ncbi:crossover junction endodeoxyribonuclease RuvC [Legionella sp.]|uniref:crossover junction endodeoxyribonuclease RuvC n=1 Tax=Legionella sp. TaxID=459 RepID=UPI003C97DAC5